MITIDTILELIQSAKYPLLFVIYLLEGPTAAFLSSVAASMGQLNILYVFPLVIIAEVMADYFFFYLGKKSSNTKIVKKINELDNDLMVEIKRLSKEEFLKVLLILKVASFLYLPGFLYLGASKAVKDSKFIISATIVCLIKDSVIMALGYFVGLELSKFEEIYNIYKAVGIMLLVVIAIALLHKVYNKQIKEFFLNVIKYKI